MCEEIEDEPYPMTSHRTERSPLAALSLHDPNDITGRDHAACNDHRHDRALHGRGSITRACQRRKPGCKRSIFTQGERRPVISMRARDPSSNTVPASSLVKRRCRVVMFSPRSPAATQNPSALSSRMSSSSTRWYLPQIRAAGVFRLVI
jgi:hypothetical protein